MGKLISYHGLLSSYEGQPEAANEQDSRGVFSEIHEALDGWMLTLKASTAIDLGTQIFFYLCMTCGC